MEVHAGNLTVKIGGFLKTKTFPNAWCILYSGKGEFSPRIDVYDKLPATKCLKSLYLEQPRWLNESFVDPGFAIDIKGKCIFIASSEAERRHWVVALSCISTPLFDTRHNIFPALGMKVEGYAEEDFVVEQNVLYASTGPSLSSFDVIPEKDCDGCQRLKLQGPYKLVVCLRSVKICKPNEDHAIAEWDFQFLREFGQSKNSFFFVAGKRSFTGEGYFAFHTQQASQIQKAISVNTNKLKYEPPTPTPGAAPLQPSSAGIPSASTPPGLPAGHHAYGKMQGPPPPALHAKPRAPLRPSLSGGGGGGAVSPPPVSPKPSIASIHPDHVSDLRLHAELNKALAKGGPGGWRESDDNVSISSGKTSSIAGAGERKLSKQEKKERERKKKEEKEEEKRRKKAEEKRKKEEKNKKKGGDKKASVSSITTTSADNIDGDIYAEAYDTQQIVAARQAVGQTNFSTGAAATVENSYSEPFQNKPSDSLAYQDGQVYSEPWENRAILAKALPNLNNNNNNNNIEYKDDKVEEMYTLPEKPAAAGGAAHSKPLVADEYEDVGVPPAIPVKQFVVEDDEEEVEVYEHLNQAESALPPPQENVYGMASARPLAAADATENVYEESGYSGAHRQSHDTTYESVGM